MAKIGIILISDYHYGIVRNHYSLTEMVRDYILNETSVTQDNDISFRHIIAKDISSMCRVYPHKLEDLRFFIDSNDHNICFIALGMSNYKSGYNFGMFRTHYQGIISEIYNLSDNVNVVNICGKINNNLKGHFSYNYLNITSSIETISNENNSNIIYPDIKILFLNNGDYVISTKTIPNMIKCICKEIINYQDLL